MRIIHPRWYRPTPLAHGLFVTPTRGRGHWERVMFWWLLLHIMRPFGQEMDSRCQVHYDDVIMAPMASQITNLTVVYSIVYSDANQRKHQNSASLAFVWGIHRGTVNSPHKWPVTRKMFPFDDVIMDRITKLCSRGPSVVFADMLLFWEPVLIFSISFIAVYYLHCISRIAQSWSLQWSASFDIGCDISISVWPLLRVVSLTQVYTRSPLLSVGSLALIWSLCLGENGELCCCQHLGEKNSQTHWYKERGAHHAKVARAVIPLRDLIFFVCLDICNYICLDTSNHFSVLPS